MPEIDYEKYGTQRSGLYGMVLVILIWTFIVFIIMHNIDQTNKQLDSIQPCQQVSK